MQFRMQEGVWRTKNGSLEGTAAGHHGRLDPGLAHSFHYSPSPSQVATIHRCLKRLNEQSPHQCNIPRNIPCSAALCAPFVDEVCLYLSKCTYPDDIMSFNPSPDEQDSSVSDSKKTSQPVSSGRPARNPRKAASSTQFGTGSSPLAPTRSGLTPEQPRVRRASIQLPTQDAAISPNTDSTSPEGNEHMEIQIETPTRKPRRRAEPKSPELMKSQGLSTVLQELGPETAGVSNQDEIENVRPSLGSSHTSPEIHERTGSRSKRPNVTERSASEPITPGKKSTRSGFQLDGDIAQLIRDGPKGEKLREKGSIYFFKFRPRGSEVILMKIGRTQNSTAKRLREIVGACQHIEREEHPRAVARDIPFHGFAEKLIQKELGNYQHRFQCFCGTKHKEYFQVSEDIAVKVFERWRDFCQEEPWDKNGKILPKWARRLQNRSKFCGSEAREFDHYEFARPWDAFTTPTPFERFLSDAILVWELGFPNRWLIISLAELLTIICISHQSFWTSTWTTVIVTFLLLDLVVTENMHTTTHISQLMEGGLQSLLQQLTPPDDPPVADSEVVGTEGSPESTPHQRNSEEAFHQIPDDSPAAHYQDRVDTSRATNGENNAECRVFQIW